MQSLLSGIADLFLSAPLRALFRKGPSWLGGWQGRDQADMCAEMTNSPATFWIAHELECTDLVEKKFQSYQIVVQTLAYAYLVFTMAGLIVRACIFKWAVVNPVERLLTSAASTAPRIADTCRSRTSPRRRIEAAPLPRKFLWNDTSGTGQEKNAPPH